MRTISVIGLALAAAIASSAIPALPSQAQIYASPLQDSSQRDGSMRTNHLERSAVDGGRGTALGEASAHAGAAGIGGRGHDSSGGSHGGRGR